LNKFELQIFLYLGVTDLSPFASFKTTPGLISTISPEHLTLATPSWKFSDSSPGYFISKDITIINLGGETKSLLEIGKLHK
jgi:hypothetical protein